MFCRFGVSFSELRHVDNAACEELGIARIIDLILAKHLTHNDFDVLVIDLNAVVLIDLQNFRDDVLLNPLRTLDLHDVMRVDRAIGDQVTFFNHIACVDDERG